MNSLRNQHTCRSAQNCRFAEELFNAGLYVQNLRIAVLHVNLQLKDFVSLARASHSPRGAPSRGAKLCTNLRWFARPDRVNTEPYYELPLPVTKLKTISHFRVGAHSFQIEQGSMRCPRSRDICAGAHFVPLLLSATGAIVSLIVLIFIFRAFSSSMQGFS